MNLKGCSRLYIVRLYDLGTTIQIDFCTELKNISEMKKIFESLYKFWVVSPCFHLR